MDLRPKEVLSETIGGDVHYGLECEPEIHKLAFGPMREVTLLPDATGHLREEAELLDAKLTSAPTQTCPICWESLDSKKNYSITNCGHTFCFKCITKYATINNTCPMCRSELYEEETNIVSEEEDDDEEEEEEEEDDDYDDEDDYYEGEFVCDLNRVLKIVEEKFTIQDLTVLILRRFNSRSEKYNLENCQKIDDLFWNTVNDLDEERYREIVEMHNMSYNDRNETNPQIPIDVSNVSGSSAPLRNG